MKTSFLGLLATGAMLSACASSGESLQFASATAIGGLTPDQVSVSQIDRGATTVSWVAQTSSGTTYRCHADDMVRNPSCVPG